MSRQSHFALAGIALLSLAFVGGLPGCGNPQPAVNRVQPNALEKSVFAGEWYFQQTVIDTPYSAGFTFVGEQGGLERVRWEIQEDFLIARRSYQWIANSEPSGIGGPSDEQGAPIATYRILSHFDIRRQYNPTTGEELNVIEENSTDRPWYERQFMRVDWSTNLTAETDLFLISRIIDGLQAEPVAYYVQDQNDPNRPRFEPDADGTVGYMDIVNQMFVRPTQVHIPGFGDVPSCFLFYQDHLDCAAAQISVRNSFRRVDPTEDYQPMVYTGDRMERFGYFNTLRAGYDEFYGVVEAARFHFVNRHNLWEQSHRRIADMNGASALVRCTTDDACGGHGSVCDLDWARARRELDSEGHLSGVCTIPYRDRVAQPIVYYLTNNFPESLVPDAQHFADEWNSAFVDVISSLRENECLADGGNAASCADQRNREDALRMYMLCQSPVPEGADPACGPVGTEARPGDLRYSIIGYVNEPHLSSPLGYGPSSADPLTGEIIMANAFVYGAAMETLGAQGRDVVRLLNGDLGPVDLENGSVVQAWIDRQTANAEEAAARGGAIEHVVSIDPLHLDDITAGMDFSWARDVRPESARQLPRSAAEFEAQRRDSLSRLAEAGGFGSAEASQARATRLVGTDTERQLAGPEMRMAAGIDPNVQVDDEVVSTSSILRGMSMESITAVRQMRDRIQQQACVLNTDFADDGLLGLARQIQAAATTGDGSIEWYGHTYALRAEDGSLDYELVREMLRHPIFEAVTAHEVGHTLGLRHNFSGSFDAVNYLPGYWSLRDDGSMAPRLWDPETAAETTGRIREYQYSTVMDYGNNFVVTDANGIGHYDRAAIKMGYGDMVEVFDGAANPGDAAFWAAIQSYGWSVPLRPESFGAGPVSAFEYTDWPSVVGGIANLQHRADVPYTSLQAQSYLITQGITDPFADAQDRPVVPYMFCSDEQADLNPDCLRYDAGADAYESVQSIADNYWNYYIYTNFRRSRIGFSPSSVVGRVHDRYFEKLQNANSIYVLNRSFFEDVFGTGLTPAFWEGRNGMGAWTAATGAAYGLLTRVVAAPEPGGYARVLRGDGSEVYTRTGAGTPGSRGYVSPFDGRYIETTWNFDAGYYWFDQLNRVGYFYDKVIALGVLTDPTTHFIGRDTDVDVRRYQINFASSFGPATTAFFGGVMGEDWSSIAPRFDSGGQLQYPSPGQQAIGDMGGTPVDPDAGFSIQLYASVLGMVYIPQTYDQDFLNRSRIFVRGGAEEISIDPSRTIVEFTDPRSGLTYAAVSYPEGAHETGVGAQMIERANTLQTRGEDVELRRFIDNLDIVRRLTWQLGAGAQP